MKGALKDEILRNIGKRGDEIIRKEFEKALKYLKWLKKLRRSTYLHIQRIRKIRLSN